MVFGLFINSYLAVLDLIFLIVLGKYLLEMLNNHPKTQQLVLIFGLLLWLLGNMINRIWAMVYEWLALHGRNNSWMVFFPVSSIGLGIVSVGLAWFVIGVVGVRYGIVWALMYIVFAVVVAFLLTL
jgi:hypothetical protein